MEAEAEAETETTTTEQRAGGDGGEAEGEGEGEQEPPKTKLASHGKLFVGGVPLGATESELRAHFSQFGKVAYIGTPKNRHTGAARGFAFVQFVSPDDAASALAAGHDRHVVRGTTMDVKLAQPKSSAGDTQSSNKKKIFIGGLAPAVGEKQLKKYFKTFGEVSRAIVVTELYTNMPRGFGFIEFTSEESAARALKKERHYLCGHWVEVRLAMPKLQQDSAAGSSRLSVQARPFYPARSSALSAANSTSNAPVIAPVTYVVSDNTNPNIGYEIPGVLLSQDVVDAVIANYLRGGGAPPQGSALKPQAAAYYSGAM